MARFFVALLAAAALPFTQAQNETTEDAVAFLFPDYCCTVLALTPLNKRVLFPGQSTYQSRISSYFSLGAQLTPNCIVQPQTSQEVALAVKTLTIASVLKPCKFAIRSGGHTPYVGASNIEDGVTIDLGQLNSISYNAGKSLVSVGPGANWRSVYDYLEPKGVMVAGGRSSTVGVGGLVLGGGISYFSGRYGMVCDNVLAFEVVLADGRIVTASKTSNADLYSALKGGNNNFGIVTRLDISSFPYTSMWGGLVLYPPQTLPAHFAALVNFANNMDQDPDAAAIVMSVYQTAIGANLVMNAYDYTKPTPRPAAYDEFLAVPGNISDTTRITTLSSLAVELEGPPIYRVAFLTLTFKNDIRVLNKANELYLNVLEKLKAEATGTWSIYVLYQPLPTLFHKDSAAKGGNVLGLERYKENLILYQPYISWEGAGNDALFQAQGEYLINEIRAYAKSIAADIDYLYLDYADKTQNPLASYGEANLKKIKTVAAKYDPFGVFQKLVPGGFKASKA